MLAFLERRKEPSPSQQREYWIRSMSIISEPVLQNLANGTLRENLPVFKPERQPYAPLEAFGRLANGISPWLEVELRNKNEQILQKKHIELFHKALDAAFLCQALLRAPNSIVQSMSANVKDHLIQALEITRKIDPLDNNWILFAAMVETGLSVLDADCNYKRIDKYIQKMLSWYKGDGIYGDGPDFHFDYYNSFVIHPMLVDLVQHHNNRYEEIVNIVVNRAKRYSVILERLISPEGYYPIVGRSICYRFGAFHLLAQAILKNFLDDSIHPAQVRCALTKVIQNSTSSSGTFDKSGWLQPGVYGSQPSLAESYVSVGSLYLLATVFLPLGLSESHEFWVADNQAWTSKKMIGGQNIIADGHLRE